MDEIPLPKFKQRFKGLKGQSDEETLAVLLALREIGITDRQIANAFEALPRRFFLNVGRSIRSAKFNNMAPIPCGQVQTAPLVIAKIISALNLSRSHKVLDLGTGSGFQTALLAQLSGPIFTVDRFATLTQEAEKRFRSFDLKSIVTRQDDGATGWPENETFDRIVINFAVSEIHPRILGQLREDGILIAPILQKNRWPTLMRFEKKSDRLEKQPMQEARFLGSISGIAASL